MAITTTKPLRIGILGSGSAAKLFASAIKSTTETELWSVYSRQRELSTELAAAFGAKAQQPAHDDLQTMLRDPDLEAVIVASPDGMHARQVLAAAAAGKHVLVEKPMALDLGEADRMIAACKEARVCLAVGYRARWHDGHRRIAAQLAEGNFGKIRHVHASWSYLDVALTNWRYSHELSRWGALSKLGTHLIDFGLWMNESQGPVAKVKAILQHGGRRTDESAIVIWSHESGATCEIVASVATGEGESRAEIHCDDALIELKNTFAFHGGGKLYVNGEELMFSVKNEFVDQLEDLAKAVRRGREPFSGGRVGRQNLEVLVGALGEPT